mgnify:CR=1 FL=1
MKKYRIYKLCILLTLLLTVDAQAQQVNQFSVQQAIEYAKKNSVYVKNALLDILIQKQTNRDITSIAMPQVNASAGMTHNFNIPVQKIPDFISPSTYKVLIDNGVKDGNGQAITYPAGGFNDLNFPLGTPWNINAGVTLTQISAMTTPKNATIIGTVRICAKAAALPSRPVKVSISPWTVAGLLGAPTVFMAAAVPKYITV